MLSLKSKTIIFIVAVLLVFGFNYASANVSNQLLELSKKIQELQAMEKQLKSGIVTKQNEVVSLARDISVLNAQILRIQTSLSRTENEIEVTGLQIQQVREDIFDVEDVTVCCVARGVVHPELGGFPRVANDCSSVSDRIVGACVGVHEVGRRCSH